MTKIEAAREFLNTSADTLKDIDEILGCGHTAVASTVAVEAATEVASAPPTPLVQEVRKDLFGAPLHTFFIGLR